MLYLSTVMFPDTSSIGTLNGRSMIRIRTQYAISAMVAGIEIVNMVSLIDITEVRFYFLNSR